VMTSARGGRGAWTGAKRSGNPRRWSNGQLGWPRLYEAEARQTLHRRAAVPVRLRSIGTQCLRQACAYRWGRAGCWTISCWTGATMVQLMPSDLALKAMNAVHRAVLRISGGRLGWQFVGMPVLELTTTGRRTGRPRTVVLTTPLQVGDALVVVASRWGDDENPAWFLNVRDDPDVRVSLQGRPEEPMRARVATPQEREELWPRIIADHRNYAAYQRRTSRAIPLVLLEPAD
jgi:deazaflavin-dependent oxidoreductase (nitroreductase family)